MGEQTIQILNMTRQELLEIIKEGVKLELNRQKAIGQTTFNNSHEKYLSRSETAKLLHVTEVTLNNWEKKNILIPCRIGGRVLYKEIEVLERLVRTQASFAHYVYCFEQWFGMYVSYPLTCYRMNDD